MTTENEVRIRETLYEYIELIRKRTDNDYVPEIAGQIAELFTTDDIKQLLHDFDLMKKSVQIKIDNDEQKEYVMFTKDLWDDTLKFYEVK